MGKIAGMLNAVEPAPSPLQKEMGISRSDSSGSRGSPSRSSSPSALYRGGDFDSVVLLGVTTGDRVDPVRDSRRS
jgi:hypothetical protein